MSYELAAIVGVGVLEAALLVWAVGALRRAARLDARLGQLTDALALLSETTESGFKAAALELGRLAEVRAVPAAPAPSARWTEPSPSQEFVPAPAKPRRPTRSPRSAVPGAPIAAPEPLARGEGRLRLHMAEPTAPSRGAAGRGGDHGALRA